LPGEGAQFQDGLARGAGGARVEILDVAADHQGDDAVDRHLADAAVADAGKVSKALVAEIDGLVAANSAAKKAIGTAAGLDVAKLDRGFAAGAASARAVLNAIEVTEAKRRNEENKAIEKQFLDAVAAAATASNAAMFKIRMELGSDTALASNARQQELEAASMAAIKAQQTVMMATMAMRSSGVSTQTVSTPMMQTPTMMPTGSSGMPAGGTMMPYGGSSSAAQAPNTASLQAAQDAVKAALAGQQAAEDRFNIKLAEIELAATVKAKVPAMAQAEALRAAIDDESAGTSGMVNRVVASTPDDAAQRKSQV
jgi:hypothetical protein